MEEAWPWITTLPSSTDWPSTDSPLSLPLAASADKSILLKAERTAGSDSETLVAFSISLHGFQPSNPNTSKTLWLSNPFPLSSPSTHLLLLAQLLEELVLLAPSSHAVLPPSRSSSAPNLDVGPVAAAVDACRDESVSAFFALSLLCRLFWLCAFDAPADAGFLFFRSIDPAVLGRTLDACKPAMRGIVAAIGADWEERFMRSLGYMLTKWSLLQQLQTVGPKDGTSAATPSGSCPSFAVDAYGLWTLRGYAPIQAMARVSGTADGVVETRDSVLRYALAHQQLEAVVQLEYVISMQDPRFIRVSVRVDNIRLHVVRLGFRKEEDVAGGGGDHDSLARERHFPSRVRIWVGPEAGRGAAYATGLSLGRSTGNPEREVETTRTVKGNLGSAKLPGLKAKSRSSVRARERRWRWEQEAEGSAAVFEGVLCDGGSGAEVAAGGGGTGRRHGGAFSKVGGLVVAGDELPEGVSWRVGREMEGRV
ncbi:uncharacterized protein M6B38_104840 [Iris pallida]|uniref:Uncharacterized protein n=1 Tax=Iris pallida TaxID=29817 RepID=A0AAX6F3P9_IRIPA|nr:uncharacterized protein M6B38_104840 [Iris pallida]